jgi:hypothetical protein
MCKSTFATLEQILLQLGFEVRTIPESHVLFEHRKVDVHLILPLYKPNEVVAPRNLAYVRHTLDAWGIMARDQFEEQLRQRSLAS